MKSYLPSLLPQQAGVLVKHISLITYGQLLLDKDFASAQAVSNALERSHRKTNEQQTTDTTNDFSDRTG